ncbi:contractile injection system protein, VgrG/Pvc8 family [Marinomonas aquiplantarum]|uniref:contractile injection system protein, VgrG/Pvc8 family n=1 Tax=Marinomonas aquiplantarum TaxID=491951 RepID=UPI001FE2DDFE|nr:contractile injection system protein, VgrG/Pvc8 family [Marinomonas aquiplantarum]
MSGAGERIINNLLTLWERIDAAGTQSDQLTLHIDTTGQTGLPKEGAVLTWQEGYGDNLIDKGQFKITRIVPKLFPPSVTIVATAAPFQVDDNTGFKERRTRTFENVSLADLFRHVVTPHGFSPRVAKEFESLTIEHLDQIDETDSAFLARIARERDAIAKPVNDLYVLAKRGQVKTITGQAIPPVVVTLPSNNAPSEQARFINAQLDRPSRQRIKGVKANWTNSNTGEEHTVAVGTAPFKKLRQTYDNQANATQACQEELIKNQRQGTSVHLELPGNPKLVAEGILTLNHTFPAEMRGNWSIDKVTARGDSKAGYRCSVVASEVV